jgi:hypothetical protein
MEALDGNAIAGELEEHFGADMTNVDGTCAHCGGSSVIAELRVYLRAPGAVVRCRHCDQVVMVLVNVRGVARFDHAGFTLPG